MKVKEESIEKALSLFDDEDIAYIHSKLLKDKKEIDKELTKVKKVGEKK